MLFPPLAMVNTTFPLSGGERTGKETGTQLRVSVDRFEETYPNLKFPGSREIRDATIAELSRVADVFKREE
jgi:hypothetical protein